MMVGREDAIEFLKEAVRGAVIEAGVGLLGARIDELADLTIDAVVDHPEMAVLAVGAEQMPLGKGYWVDEGGTQIYVETHNAYQVPIKRVVAL